MLTLLTAFLLSAGSAQPTVAVLPPVPIEGDQTWLGYVIADNLETALLRHTTGSKKKRVHPLSVFSWRQALSAARSEGLDTKKVLSAAEIRRLGKQLGTRYVFEGSYRITTGKKEQVLLKWRLTDLDSKKKPRVGQVKTNQKTLSARSDKLAVDVLKRLGEKPGKAGKAEKVPFEGLRYYGQGLEALAAQSLNPRARFVLTDDDLRRAHGLFSAATRVAPDMQRATVARAITTAMHGAAKKDIAEEWLAAAVKGAGELEPLNVLGRYYLHARQGQHERAIEVLSGATRSNPGFLLALGYLGEAYFRARKPKEALEVFDRYAQRVPASAWVRMMRARALSYLDRHDEAIAEMKKLAKKLPKSVSVSAQLAARLMHAKQFDEARKTLDKAIAMHGEHPRLLTRLSYIEIEQGRPDVGLELAQRAVKQLGAGRGETTAGYAHANLGHAYALLGDKKKATAAFDKAAALGLGVEDRERLLNDPRVSKLLSDGPPPREIEMKEQKPDAKPKAPAGTEGEKWDGEAEFAKDEDWKY